MTTLLVPISALVLALAPPPSSGAGTATVLPGPTLQVACQPPAAERVQRAYERWQALMERRGSLSPQALNRRTEALVAEVFALEAMGARIYGEGEWARLSAHRRSEFTDALKRHLRAELVAHFEELAAGEAPVLHPAPGNASDNGALHVDYWVVRGQRTDPVSFSFRETEGGDCGIVDVGRGDRSVTATVRERVRKLESEYSFAYMIGELGDYGYVALEDFEDDSVGALPREWGWKDSDDRKRKPYEVRSENGNKYLAARDEGESVILGKEIKWNLNEYPYVSFRVRVHEIPPGGDERYGRTVDSAAGLYFTYKKKMLGLVPEPVKYVWSSTLPVGAAAIRDGVGRPWQIVFGSGTDGLGEWRTYVFDLKQAYRDTFGGNPPDRPIGIGVLSDANSVGGKAYADYDDIRALKTAPPGTGSGVKEILRGK